MYGVSVQTSDAQAPWMNPATCIRCVRIVTSRPVQHSSCIHSEVGLLGGRNTKTRGPSLKTEKNGEHEFTQYPRR